METYDITKNRHKGNPQSRAVNPPSSVKNRDRREVYRLIQKAADKGSAGITSKEIAKQMGRRLHCISGRISELKQDGKVVVIGRRNECGIIHPIERGPYIRKLYEIQESTF